MRNQSQMKEIIADAFFDLARQKSIDKITVKDLVDYCDISRQSFYYHFQDILDVIEWSAQRIEEAISVRVRAADSLEEAVRILISSFIEHYDLTEKLRDSQKRNFVEQLVMNSMQERFRQAARDTAADRPQDMNASEAEAIIAFFSFGFAGLIMAHCKTKAPNVEELTRQALAVFRYLAPDMDGKT